MTIRAALLSLGLLAVFSGFASAVAPGQPSAGPFPHTEALWTELNGTHGELTSIATRLGRTKDAVADARKQVQDASALVKKVDSTDDTLVRVIRQLKPLSAIPQLRLLKTVVKNLEALQKKVHEVRLKADKAEKEVFKPLRTRLMELEVGLQEAIAECKLAASRAKLTREAIGLSRDVVQSQGSRRAAVAALEILAKSVRLGIVPVHAGVKALDDSAADAEKVAAKFAATVKGLTALGPAVAKLVKDLSPVDATARELDKVLSQKISVKIAGQDIGFSVRQVLQGPGDVADFILKPLEDLADKALGPILKKLKLEIALPAEFAQLAAQLSAVTTKFSGLDGPLKNLEQSLNSTFLADFQKSLDAVPKVGK